MFQPRSPAIRTAEEVAAFEQDQSPEAFGKVVDRLLASPRNGRDHNPFGFTMRLAGGGVKGGTIYSATDDFGFEAVEKPVHDLPATILSLLGIDHTKLTYRCSGRDFPLTDVSGNVIHDIIA